MHKKQKYLHSGHSDMPDTGALLADHMANNRLSIAALSRRMNRSLTTVDDYRKRPSMQTGILWELSHALKHNFFADLAAGLPAEYSSNAAQDTEPNKRIEELERVLEKVKAERDLLERLLKPEGPAGK